MSNKHEFDPFFQYVTVPHETSEGNCFLPMFFFDAANHFAMFYVDIEKARELTRGTELDPVEFHKGKTLAAIASFDYRQASINPYLEVGLAIACTPKGVDAPTDPLAAMLGDPDNHHMAFCVIDLPVSTNQATAAGIELWGFPKFTTDIGFNLDGDRFEGSVADPTGKGTIYTLSGESLGGAKLPSMSMVYFTRLNGRTLRIHGIARGLSKYALPGTLELKVGNSDHRMAQNMRTLGLNCTRPDFVFYSDFVQIRLTAGYPLP